MGLFDPKYCDNCGEKLGLLGNTKIANGTLCKNCGSKLSPFLSNVKQRPLSDIKNHLMYREDNERILGNFKPDKEFGKYRKIFIDSAAGVFCVARANWKESNPDLITLEQIINVETEVEEKKEEILYENKDGTKSSYHPQKFEYEYTFRINIYVDSPWFDKISVDLSDTDHPELKWDEKYTKYDQMLREAKAALLRREVEPAEPHEAPVKPAAPAPAPAPAPTGGHYADPTGMAAAHLAHVQAAKEAGIYKNPNEWKCFCGTVNTGNFCTNCGNPKPTRTCKVCGWKAADSDPLPRFCQNCGAEMNKY